MLFYIRFISVVFSFEDIPDSVIFASGTEEGLSVGGGNKEMGIFDWEFSSCSALFNLIVGSVEAGWM